MTQPAKDGVASDQRDSGRTGSRTESKVPRGTWLAVAIVLLWVALPAPLAGAATACGGDGQRGCCLASTERLSSGACHAGNAEVDGCTGDCACGGSGMAPFLGLSSSSHCEAVSACGGAGERACCITETRWDTNPIPASGGCRYDGEYAGTSGLAEIAGGSGQGQLCGGTNPLGFRSNGTCVLCGTEGSHACVGVPVADECRDGLTKDAFGFCASCGREGQPVCDVASASPTCALAFHPDGGVCIADRTIAEPDCDCDTSTRAPNPPTLPVNGFADLHLHMFSNLAFGGLTVWGDAFHPAGGISQALRADNFAMRTKDRLLNGHVITGIGGDALPVDPFRQQTLVHGDGHFNDLIGAGNGQHFPAFGPLANSGVEWDAANFNNGANPDFLGWPRWNSVTHQQAYYRWLERAHKGGLQLTVLLAVNNETMCASGRRIDDPDFSCSDTMAGIRLQLAEARRFEQWLDSRCVAGESGACALDLTHGQKAGWFKIVESPSEARAAIARGQLAVVLGIEDATLFGCKSGVCTAESVRAQLDAFRALGVRHVFPIHNFDNGFGGAATWQDTIALGNAFSTGSFYDTENCPDSPALDSHSGYGKQLFESALGNPLGEAFIVAQLLGLGLSPTDPNYLQARLQASLLDTTCSRKGLTSLGSFLIRELMSRRMIIDVDHMSIKSLDATLDLAATESYPGIVASHVLMFDLTEKAARHERMRTRAQLERIAGLGGMIGVMTQAPEPETGIVQPGETDPGQSAVVNDCKRSSKAWAQAYRYAVDVMTVGGVAPGVAFGTDFNGISRQLAPRFGAEADSFCEPQDDATRVQYPFTVPGFGSFREQRTSSRVFDFNESGLAHVGLLPDLIEDTRKVGLTGGELAPLFRSAEQYLHMWEQVDASQVAPLPLDDQVPPVTTATVLPAAGKDGWRTSDVAIALSAIDYGNPDKAPSGVAEILHGLAGTPVVVTAGAEASRQIGQEGVYSLQFSARDLRGNQEVTQSLQVKLDKTPPSIVLGGRTPANVNGWNRTDVEVSAECSDALSGVSLCESPKTLASEGANQSLALAARDLAGNGSSVTAGPIHIDKSAPLVTVTGVGSGQTYRRGAVPAAACETTDQPALSGVAVPAALTLSGGTAQGVGSFVATCTGAQDRADNGAPPVSAAYSVHYRFAGFFEPIDNPPVVNVMKAGRSVPVRFSLGGNMGLGILGAGGPSSTAVPCGAGVAAVESRPATDSHGGPSHDGPSHDGPGHDGPGHDGPGHEGLSYDRHCGQYSYVWKTDKEFAGSCRRFELNLNDGSSHAFVVRFR
jgi:microsomal dipeptidase-like Zn-dependent dipeptidase